MGDPEALALSLNSLGTIGDAMARPIAEAILAAPAGTYDLSTLFAFGNGGAPLSAAVREELKRAAPNAVIVIDVHSLTNSGRRQRPRKRRANFLRTFFMMLPACQIVPATPDAFA